jgi:hypothetical protein
MQDVWFAGVIFIVNQPDFVIIEAIPLDPRTK